MIRQDIRYAFQSLWRSKGFAAVAILCLGLGIGVNTTIFSSVDGVLLQPYPYADPDRILVIGEQNPVTHSRAGLSYPDMRDWKEGLAAKPMKVCIGFKPFTHIFFISDSAVARQYHG